MAEPSRGQVFNYDGVIDYTSEDGLYSGQAKKYSMHLTNPSKCAALRFGGRQGAQWRILRRIDQIDLPTSENHRILPKSSGAGFCSIFIVFSALFAPQKRR